LPLKNLRSSASIRGLKSSVPICGSTAVIKLSAPDKAGFWEIPVLWEDEHLMALNKPTGLLTSPDRHDPQRPNLMKLLHAGIAEGKPWAERRALNYVMNVYRLDFETSGLILLAKSKAVLVQLANVFGLEESLKTYVALVQGAPTEDRFEVAAKLAPHPVKAGMMRVDPKGGKHARTIVRVLERFSGFSLVQCDPLTDRTHQIRVHLRHQGLPIVGDALYGGRALLLSRIKREYRPKHTEPERPLMGRVALHAAQLQLPHPVTGEALTIVAPWPKDLEVSVKYLRKFAVLQVAG
jgi:RluA family pseudouridine synthase